MNEAEPTLAELIRRAIASRLADVHVSMPGIVVDYDATKKTATVQPGLRRVVFDENDDRIEEEIPPLQNVPVAFWGGAKLSVNWDLQPGDTGTLIVPTNSTNEFQGTARVSTPGSLKLHDLGSAVFQPHPYQANAPADTGDSIGRPGGLRLSFKDATIEAGMGAAFVALATLVDARFTALETFANAHVHTSAAPGSPTSPAVTPLTPGSSTASSNLKADP